MDIPSVILFAVGMMCITMIVVVVIVMRRIND